jgi:hypothetical protein
MLGPAPNILLIPGTRTRGHLAENLAAAGVSFDDAAVDPPLIPPCVDRKGRSPDLGDERSPGYQRAWTRPEGSYG